MTATPPPSSLPTRLGSREFIALMAMVQALQALAVDSMLPALGRISADLGVADANRRQLVVGLFLISLGVGSLAPGALADRFGRRPVLIGCLGSYIALSMVCALAPSFDMLLAARAVLGVLCAGLMVLPAAIIRDMYAGDRMARLQSSVAVVFMVVPMIAPSIGQAVLLVAGWRWIFGVMVALGTAVALWVGLRLPETLRPQDRQPISVRGIGAGMWAIIAHRRSMGYVLAMALMQGGLFGYINCSQQLVAEHFGAGPRFPLLFAAMAAMMASTNWVNARIVERFGARRVSHAALLVYLATSLAQVLTAFGGHETLWSFVPLMTLNLCLMGFLGANFTSIALQPFARIAGSAASAQTFIRMVLSSGLGALVGRLYDGTARPLALALLMAGGLALLLIWVGEKGKMFGRSSPIC